MLLHLPPNLPPSSPSFPASNCGQLWLFASPISPISQQGISQAPTISLPRICVTPHAAFAMPRLRRSNASTSVVLQTIGLEAECSLQNADEKVLRIRRSGSSISGKTTAISGLIKEKETHDLDKDEEEEEEEEEEYDWPPLVCCFGQAISNFLPTVRVSERQKHPDMYSTWKYLQWSPPEFTRAPGGPSFHVAIALARLGGKVCFMGKVGDDAYGRELVHTLNVNRVQTRGVRFDSKTQTAVSQLRMSSEDGELRMSCVQPCAEDSFLETDINDDVLKEARMLHFNSTILTVEPIRTSLFKAIGISKRYGGVVFFDLNLPLPLWNSREEAWNVIQQAWLQSNVIEVTKQELEFLLGEEKCRRKPPQYYSLSPEGMSNIRDEYHYELEEIVSIWHENMKMLFVTDGTYVIHYYGPEFDGKVLGVEDVMVASFSCDRTGSGDAMVAGILRKLAAQPELYDDQKTLEKALRFAMSAGVIAQWTPGAIKGLPTESAAQNLTEQVYRPVFVQPLK